MTFQAGDRVVHWNYGLGVISQIDEKILNGRTLKYYVLETSNMMIWVPVSEAGDNRLRLPTPPADFEDLFAILSSPAQPLSDDRLERKTQLSDQLKDGRLASVCQVLRDLTFRFRGGKINDHDKAVMERAQNFLLDEWTLALSVPAAQARKQMRHFLGEEISAAEEPV